MKRIVAALLSVLLFAPSAVIAQPQPKAGVVTTLEGNVTARRVALPDAVPLKFKDDVLLQDTVTTGDKSLARMLLGGKAVVTVRERSVLTITEVPGRSTLELETGKFALAVAREKMRPGEEILIRTPNAIAGVRGTVVITEVSRQTAQLGRASGGVVTNFYVLRGSITAQPLDIGTRQPLGTPLNVGTMFSYAGAGTAVPRVAPVPPEQVGQITSGLKPTGPKGGSQAGQEQVKEQAVETAVALVGTLTGSGSGMQMAAVVAPPTSGVQESKVNPEINPLDSLDAGDLDPEQALNDFILFLGTLTLTQPARTFSTPFTSTALAALLQFKNASIFQFGEDLDFIQVKNGAVVTLAGPLATFIDSLLFTTGSLFDMVGGKLTSTTPLALFSADPTFLLTGDALITMTGGLLTLAGPLFTDLNGFIFSEAQLFRMDGGATLLSTSPAALVQLTGTVVSTTGALSMTNATMQLAGPLVTAVGVTSGDDLFGGEAEAAALFLLDASKLTSTSPLPLIQFSSMEVDHDENFLRLSNASTLTLGGSLLKFTDTHFDASNVDRSFIALIDGSKIVTVGTNEPLLSFVGTAPGASQVSAARNFFAAGFNSTNLSPSMTLSGPFLNASQTNLRSGDGSANVFSFMFIADGTQVSSTSASPFLTFTNSTLDSSADLLSLRRSRAGTPTRLTLAGPLLVATNSTFNHTSLGFGPQFGGPPSACCSAFFIGQGAHLTSTTTQALVQLTNSTVTGNDAQSGGNFFDVLETFGGAPAAELVASSNVSLAGPLLKANGSTVTELFSLMRIQRSTLSSTSTAPLIDITGGSVTLGGTNAATGGGAIGNLLFVVSGPTAGGIGFPASVTLGGPLASLTNTTYASGAGNVVSIVNGGAYTAGGSGATFQLNGTTLSGFNFLNTGGAGGPAGTTNSSVSLAGPWLTANNSTISLGSNVIGVFGASTFTSTTAAALMQLTGTNLTAGTTFQQAEVLQVNGFFESPGLVTLNGPVFTATGGSNVNVPGALFGTFDGGQLVVNGSADPLFAFTGGTHAFGTNGAFGADAAFSLNGLAAQVEDELIDETDLLTLGTRKPVQAAGSLLETTGATVNTTSIVKLDTALLEASAPILNARAGSNITTSSHAIDLVQQAKLSTNAINPLLRLDASTLTIANGSALAVRGGSFLNVGGDIFAINNGSTLNILNGALLLASGDSVVKAQRSLINFGGVGNVVNITNNLCAAVSCHPAGGLNVFLTNGAQPGNVTITTPITNPGGGTINLSNGANTAHIIVDGANTKVKLGVGF